MNKKAVLVISFGTSYQETRKKTLDAIEADISAAFPGYEFRRAYTSPTIINILRKRDGLMIDNVEEALTKLVQEGYQTVLAQTTHVIHGFEYDKMMESIARFQDQFETLVCGAPLLTADADYREAAGILGRELMAYRKEKTDVVLMGHGTEHAANESYEKLQQVLCEEGLDDFLVGTVEASPTLEHMLAAVKDRDTEAVLLTPFMIVAGDHAYQDMAGDDKDSWKPRFKQNGYQVECLMKGLGEYADIRKMYIKHAKQAEAMIARG